MMEKLKPCPFCGGGARVTDDVCVIPVIDENGAYVDAEFEELPVFVHCTVCGAETYGYETAEEAIEAWNRRVSDG